ncbi:glycosyltransferase [Flavilitoribacter nigricans]|uniref:Glycosyltransferase 2-like domain-containing protein n=1 Tax=Flavilitoribacter nigricans (strain ATCC 23147 / DSM 23189 / NBRC 102662 / NCIMB 1420 / SS-2) TaxID=1122177 RepID=A0A2D0MYX1_FLAN2|nr:glycosyltransferase family 2 protein [Flavilitoribacter nigricans]PHN01471.1 hypothetical protein CRP01_36835 [Flavilitoribacter nigricans DSM 23189 = NBRC 102662]
MKDPLVSVVIPNYNNQVGLERCLNAVFKQTYSPGQTEVIVVDNDSDDQSVKISKKFPLRLLIRPEYRSPYWCRNAGIQQAKGEYLVLLDSNCVPSPDWLRAGVQALNNSGASVVTGPVRFQFSLNPSFAEKIDYLYSVIRAEDIPHATGLPATHLFIRAPLFRDLGLFIPHIRSLGDIEWTNRAHQKGYTFGFAESAIVDYPAKNWKKAIEKMVRLGGGKKELWVAGGRSVYTLQWWGMIVKNLLPPSNSFFRDMQQRNLQEKTELPKLSLWLGLWGIKICRAIGMISKRTIAFPARTPGRSSE